MTAINEETDDGKICAAVDCRSEATTGIEVQAGECTISIAVCGECKKFFVEDNPK